MKDTEHRSKAKMLQTTHKTQGKKKNYDGE